MKLMSFKINPSLLEEMEQTCKDHHFSSKTEFIRTAIREKIERCKTVHYMTKNIPLPEKNTGRVEYTG